MPFMSRTSLYSAFIAVWAIGCKTTPQGAQLKTDLSDNVSVKEAVENHKLNGQRHCTYTPNYKRVIVTGFGLFGSPFNISGIVAMSMAKPEFFPDNIILAQTAWQDESLAKNLQNNWSHNENFTENGVFLSQRLLTIDHEPYAVCFLLLDVKWDQAAAIILHEARNFRPDLILMSGVSSSEQNKLIFESSAFNNARQLSGFHSNGSSDERNQPLHNDSKVIPDLALNEIIPLTWNALGLAKANAPFVEEINSGNTQGPLYGTTVGFARGSNNYVCNNVSIAVTAALTGRTIHLAGGELTIEGMNFGTKVGFLHYPHLSSLPGNAEDGWQIYGWARVLANSIKHSLKD